MDNGGGRTLRQRSAAFVGDVAGRVMSAASGALWTAAEVAAATVGATAATVAESYAKARGSGAGSGLQRITGGTLRGGEDADGFGAPPVEDESLAKLREAAKTDPVARALLASQETRGLTYWEPDNWYLSTPTTEDRPGPLNRLSFDALRAMSRTPFVSPILHEYERQLAMFARQQPTREAVGFDIVMADAEAKPKSRDKARIRDLLDFTTKCGFWTAEQEMSRFHSPFSRFLRSMATNLITYDGAPIEVIPAALSQVATGTKLGQLAGRVPAAFQALAGNTIRMIPPRRNEGGRPGYRVFDPDAPAFAQVWQSRVYGQWAPRHMAYVSLRPRLDFESHGYGWPFFEELVDVVTWLLWGAQYNSAQFKSGMLGNGMFIYKAKLKPEQFASFKTHFQALMTGVTNAHRVGFINLQDEKDDFKFDNLGRQSNRDGEYMEWTRYLIQLACAIAGVDPMGAFGMMMGAEGQSTSLNSPSPDSRSKISWAKSIPHILIEIEHAMNTHIYGPLTDGQFKIVFRGLEEEQEAARMARLKSQLEMGYTFDEVRAEADMEPLGPENGGDLVGNAHWMQWKLAQGGGEGMPGEGEEGGGMPGGGGGDEDEGEEMRGAPGGPRGEEGDEGEDDGEEGDDLPPAPPPPARKVPRKEIDAAREALRALGKAHKGAVPLARAMGRRGASVSPRGQGAAGRGAALPVPAGGVRCFVYDPSGSGPTQAE